MAGVPVMVERVVGWVKTVERVGLRGKRFGETWDSIENIELVVSSEKVSRD
jgi:hypothetical protein